MELSAVLRKVRALVAIAEHEKTEPVEAEQARAHADRLMLQFAIDEAALDASRPAESRGKPETIEVDICDRLSNLSGYFSWLVDVVARYSRCKVRSWTRCDYDRNVWMATVYGYESDLRYFEIVYTTLLLHMSSVLVEGWSDSVSDDENVYRLHNAGFNWAEIAQMRGWVKDFAPSYPEIKNPYHHRDDPRKVVPSTTMSARFKTSYLRACRKHGTEPVQVPAGGSATYRTSAAGGYVSRIGQRLIKTEQGRDAAESGALVLRRDDLEDFFRKANPDLFREEEEEFVEQPQPKRRQKKYVPPPFNHDAYAAGARHADTADIGGNKMPNQKTGQLT
jgi:hypothetical protein